MLIVQKYGGTSVADVEHIERVAQRCLETQRAGNQVAVVVSAMAGETNRLLALAKHFREDVNDREFDVIVSTGEQVSVGLLALAIRARGGRAQSFLGHQVKILTDGSYARARIRSIDASALERCFASDTIAVIAGFQGVDDAGNITTLGRGGSDTTGVAIAAALSADVCEIYTDVDGVYTADPRVVPDARMVDRISYEAMIELSSVGAKVLQIRSVEMAMKYAVPIHVRSSFHQQVGTWVVPEESAMEHVLVDGVAAVRDESKITVRAVPDVPGVAATLLSPLADAGIVIGVIVQNVSHDGTTDLSFTLKRADRARAITILQREAKDLCTPERLAWSDGVAMVSVVGAGMRSHAGVARRMFQLLSDEGINIQMISTSEIKISCVIDEKYAELAVRVLHEGFALHRPPEERPAP
ncbi:MAG: aspartate kinase [Haliangiales bacterium]